MIRFMPEDWGQHFQELVEAERFRCVIAIGWRSGVSTFPIVSGKRWVELC